jgi:alpha-ketoglutarate-dependent taurine dioxygenase
MNYHLHENGWAIIVDDFDFLTATKEDIKQISDLLKIHTLVAFKDQSLTIRDQIKISEMFGNIRPEFEPGTEEFKHESANLLEDPDGIVVRVTGELNEHGVPGTAGYVDAMEWHNNQPHRNWRLPGTMRGPLVWLYGVKGTVGSRTSYTNSMLAYKELDPELKEQIKDLKGIYYGATDFEATKVAGVEQDLESPAQSVVIKHVSGEYGIYHSHTQLENFEGMTREESLSLSEKLHNHLIQDKYCYHHDWQNGDIVIADQWFGIHKRWPFEKITERLLHRIVFGYVD